MGNIPSLSRRSLVSLLGAGLAGAALRPAFADTPAQPAPPSRVTPAPDAGGSVVRLSANENPAGLSPAALAAAREALAIACRYPDQAAEELKEAIARLHGVGPDWVLVGAGSSEILKLAATALTGPGRPLVTAQPTFEAIAAYSRAQGAEVVAVPLDAGYAHDLEKMTVPGAGLVYLCNPNNPTASLTPKARVRAFLDKASAPTVVLVDEAYHHYVDSDDYESVLPLVKTRPGLIVARTFSKIFGMAGLRLGYGIAEPKLIGRLAAQAAWDTTNGVALAAGRASLLDPGWVAEGRKRNSVTRAEVVAALAKRGFSIIPSHANFMMIDVRREAKPLIKAMAAKGVQVGRPFPALPNHLRVTIGTPEQMQRFLDAFAVVTA